MIELHMEASESKWVIPVLNNIGVDSLMLGDIHAYSLYLMSDAQLRASEIPLITDVLLTTILFIIPINPLNANNNNKNNNLFH